MGVYTQRIQAGVDDGHGNKDGTGTWFNTQNSIILGKAVNPNTALFRFTNVTIAPGATITSAKLTFWFSGGGANNLTCTILAIAEDNTASFSTDPRGRSVTSASVAWNFTEPGGIDYFFDTSDFTSVIQEIINRGGWASGNALGVRIDDNGSTFSHDADAFERSTTLCALLTINYIGASDSPSQSPSASGSASPSKSFPDVSKLLRIAKSGKDALNPVDASDLIFSSEYGTLKYFSKQTKNITIDANAGDIAAIGTYTHNLGYYPYVEVFVDTYIGSKTNNYEYCPFFGAGATVLYQATYKITTTEIVVYSEITGVSTSLWNFDFLIFVFKNDLKL